MQLKGRGYTACTSLMTLMWFRCHIPHLTPTQFNGTLRLNRLPTNRLRLNRLPTNRLPANRLRLNRLPTNRLRLNRLGSNRLQWHELRSNHLRSNHSVCVSLSATVHTSGVCNELYLLLHEYA